MTVKKHFFRFKKILDGKLKITCEKLTTMMEKLVYAPKEDKVSIRKVQEYLFPKHLSKRDFK